MATVKPAGPRFKLPWRFRLRTLLLLFSAIALPCGWEADRLHRRAQAVAFLERWELEPIGMFCDMDRRPWCWMPDSFEPWLEPLVAPWAYEYLYVGRGWWAAVSSDASSRRAADAGRPPKSPASRRDSALGEPTRDEQQEILSAVTTLKELKWVAIDFALGDDSLRSLSTLKNMEALVFTQRGLREKGVAYLQNVQTLRCLSIHFPDSDGAAMAALLGLKGHPRLSRLIITGEFDAHDLARLEVGLPHVAVETP